MTTFHDEAHSSVGGLELEQSRIKETIELPLSSPHAQQLRIKPVRGVLLYGPPGTGKSLLCRVLRKRWTDAGLHVESLAATDLVGSYPGQSREMVRELFLRLEQHEPGVLMIDEIDAIAGRRDAQASSNDSHLVAELLTRMDGLDESSRVSVVATTNRLHAIEPALRRPGRFDEEIRIGVPDASARVAIARIHTSHLPMTEKARDVLEEEVANDLSGTTGADIQRLAREIGLKALGRLNAETPESRENVVQPSDIWAALDLMEPSLLRGLNTPSKKAQAELFGIDSAVEELSVYAEECFTRGPSRQGVLLYGESGNGKSSLVERLSIQLRVPLVVVDGASVFDQWLGRSEYEVRSRLERASDLAPSVVLLEGIEMMSPSSGVDTPDHVTQRVAGTLLSTLDQLLAQGGVAVFGTSQTVESLDKRLTRQGRLGKHIEVGNPSRETRTAIAQGIIGTSHPSIEKLVADTEGSTVVEVVLRAQALTAESRDISAP